MPQAVPASAARAAQGYFELRRHELRRTRMQMIDGHLAVNSRTAEGGTSARVHEGGYWGFASETTGASDPARERLLDKATRNARAMGRFGATASSPLVLPDAHCRGEHAPAGLRTPLTPAECVERLAALHAWCAVRYPTLNSSRFVLHDEHHAKRLETGSGSEVLNTIARASLGITFVAEDERGTPVELYEPISARGSVADLDLSIEALAPLLDELHAHLQAKRRAVPARGGLHTVVLAPDMAGILAHEAMGHPCEADIVLGGAITGGLLGRRIASELVTMVDFAHTYDGAEVLMPVHADDEGVPAGDAVLIERGVLKGLMSSRETAARLGIEPTGSARAYGPHDEPLVRMRNTAILPGKAKLEQMIAEVDDGYLLLKTGNGQADSTTEFMFGVNLGYEIKGGRLGRAIRDTTVSGTALEVLASCDAVSDDMRWTASGYCGKKQPMVVSMGGPALRARAHLGGE
jgi:TldD protein